MGITHEGPWEVSRELTRLPLLTVERARGMRLQKPLDQTSESQVGWSMETKFRGHQGNESNARTDDNRGSETPKQGEGEEQLTKDSQGNRHLHEGDFF